MAASGGAVGRETLRVTLEELGAALAGDPLRDLAERALQALTSEPSKAALGVVGHCLEELEPQLLIVADDEPASPSAASDEAAAAEEGASATRDAETVELFVDFLSEGEEGLDRADEILLAAEHGGADAERVNGLFRVFHTIKGVSGFLGTSDVTQLAHATETLLDQVRSEVCTLSGPVLDAVFEASAAMRRLLGAVRESVEADIPTATVGWVQGIVAKIEGVTTASAGGSPPRRLRPAVEPGLVAVPEPAAEAEPEEVASKSREAGASRIRETVKVDLERIDSLVEMIGELIIVEAMVVNSPQLAGLSSLGLLNYLGQLTKISRDLQNVAMRMRMVPVRGVFHKMARLARDLGRKTGKSAELVQVGEATEMDRSMVEQIEEPLIHMIRNAMDHALESAEERAAAGKPATGTIQLSAQHEGGSVAIELSDDGRGLRREAILRKARQRGLINDSGEQLTDEQVFALIFLPGFSTAEKVSELSGRGVGMDVVKRSVEAMRGRIVVRSVPGEGTTFKLVLPLTLAIIDGMLVSCGRERYVVPSLAIVESLQPTPGMVRTLGRDGELINVRGEIFPLLRLCKLFELDDPDRAPEQCRVVVLESSGRKIGLLVDDVLTQQQIVIKPLCAGIGDTEFLSGAAILSDGRVGLILNVDRLGDLFGALRRARSSDVAA